MELGLNWQPADTRAAKQFVLWKDTLAIINMDKKLEELGRDLEPEDFIDNSETAKPGELVFGLRTEIESQQNMTTDIERGIVPEGGVPALVKCQSVYHKPKYGEVPTKEAYQTRTGNWVCLVCKEKRDQYTVDHMAKMRAAKAAKAVVPEVYIPPKLVIDPIVEVVPEWKVTIVVRTEMLIRASDFLDLAAQLEGKGEIVKVEKV